MYIEAENIVKYYGSVKVLKGVTLRIGKPMIYSLLGPNGAGKTTLLNILAGIQKPNSGKVLIKGSDPTNPKTRQFIGYCPQDSALYERLSGWDNIFFYVSLYGVPKSDAKRRARELLEILNLEEYASQRVAKYSGGMKKKLSLVISLVHDPEVLILDEPTTGLDPEARVKIWEILKKSRDEKKVVLIATHSMDEADKLSDKVGIIDGGELLAEDSPENLKKIYGPPSVVEVILTEKPSEDLLKRLREYFKGFYSDEYTLKIHVDDPDKAIPVLTRIIYESGSRIELLKVARPSLDDVFFRLTGRRLK